LAGGYALVRECLTALESNRVYRMTCLGGPQLGRRGLYPSLSKKGSTASVRALLDVIAYADGTNGLIAISDIIGRSFGEVAAIATTLLEHDLVEVVA
ncbi:MAG TPA: winged helix-turn-helix domain-containing protein, partial [Gammaproteobacteria bacterium]|nr:winged helix-turn-helix domain-containing protein [Gammaproteobacteria bacterium]